MLIKIENRIKTINFIFFYTGCGQLKLAIKLPTLTVSPIIH